MKRHRIWAWALSLVIIVGVAVAGFAQPPRDDVERLVDTLSHPNVTFRVEAARQLNNRNDPRALNALIAAFTDDREVTVRRAAAQSLGSYRDERLPKLFVAALRDADAEVRRIAVEALRSQGRVPEEAIPTLLGMLIDESVDARKSAAAYFAAQPDPRALDSLIAALGDADVGVRVEAARAVGAAPGPKSVDALMPLLTDPEPSVRRMAVRALQGNERAFNPTIALLQDADAQVRVAAAQSLAARPDPRATEALAALLGDPQSEVRLAAAMALANAKDARSVPPLVAAVSDPTNNGRQMAMEALGNLGDARAIDALAAIATGEEARLYWTAFRALASIPDPKAVAKVVGALADPRPQVRQAASSALASVGEVAGAAIMEVLKSPDVATRASALGALGEWVRRDQNRLTTPMALTMVASLRDESPEVRTAAARNFTDPWMFQSVADGAFTDGLLAAFAQGEAGARAAVVGVLAQRGSDDRVAPVLVAAASDPEVAVRRAVAMAPGNGPASLREAVLGLLKDPAPEVRVAAAQGLGNGGNRSEPALAALAEALKDPSLEVQRAAARTLAGMNDARGLDVLLAALRDAGNDNERQQAIWALGRIKDPRVTEALAGLIGDANENVRRAALGQLVERGDPRVIPPLIAQLSQPDWRGGNAASSLARMGDAAIGPLLETLKQPDARVREHVLRAFSLSSGREDNRLVTALMDGLRDPADGVRLQAAYGLSNVRDARTVPALLAALRDPNTQIVVAVIRALGNTRATEAVAPLIAAMAAPAPSEVRAAAVRALGSFGDPRAIDPLVAALQDPDVSVRRGAAIGLGRFRDPRSVDLLLGMLGPDVPDRDQTILVLGGMKVARAVEPLAALIKDQNLGWAAVNALQQIGSPEAIRVIASYATTATGDRRRSATQTLARMGREGVVALLALLSAQESGTRLDAAQALRDSWESARALKDTDLPPLVAALKDPSPDVRKIAAEILGRTSAAAATPALISALTDESPAVRTAAGAALSMRMSSGGSQASGPMLVAVLQRGTPASRAAAARALGEGSPNTEGLDALTAALQGDEDIAVRAAAAVALGKSSTHVPALESLLAAARSPEPTLRAAALEGLTRYRQGGTTETLIAALRDPVAQVRLAATQSLWQRRDPGTTDPLAAALADEDAAVRRGAAIALADMKDVRGLDLLLQALSTVGGAERDELGPWTDTPRLVIEALGRLGDSRAVAPLAKLAANEQYNRRQEALMAIARIGGEEGMRALSEALLTMTRDEDEWMLGEPFRQAGRSALPTLVTALASENAPSRRTAVALLRNFREALLDAPIPGLVEGLVAALRDSSENTRSWATSALGQMRDPRVIAPLVQALSDSSVRVRDQAGNALRTVVYASADLRTDGRRELLPLMRDGTPEARAAVIRVLVNDGDRQVVEALCAALQDQSPIMRVAAAESLAPGHPAMALRPLLAATQDAATEVRVATVRALAWYGEAEALDAVISALQDRESAVRITAAQALTPSMSQAYSGFSGSQILSGPRRGIPFSGSDEVYYPYSGARANRGAGMAMARSTDPRIAGALAALLADPDAEVRNTAALALAMRKDARGYDVLAGLLTHPDADTRRRAVTALGFLGDRRAVPALIALLKDADSSLTNNITSALGRIGGPEATTGVLAQFAFSGAGESSAARDAAIALGKEAVPGLLALLATETPARAQVVGALAQLGGFGHLDGAAVEPLASVLRDPTEGVRRSAVQALGSISDVAAIAPLAQALADPQERVRYEARQRLGTMLDRGGEMRETATQVVLAVLRDGTVDARVEAARLLVGQGAVQAMTALREAARDEAPSVRAAVVQVASVSGDPEVLALVLAAAQDPAPEVRAAAARQLEGTPAPMAVDGLLALLGDDSAEVRMAAASTLGRPVFDGSPTPRLASNPRIPDRLAAALQDPDLGVRQAAAVSLAKRQDARGLDLLMETAASADGGPSSVAAFALGELKDPRAVPALIAVVDREVRLYDPMRGDTGGARNMARALGQIGGPEALRALLGWLKATGMDRSYMFSETTEGLAAIGRPAVPGLLDLLKSDTTAVRRAAAQTLRQMKADQLDGQAIAPLVAALHDPASAVRASVVTALGRIPGTTTHLTAMMDDPAVEVRSAAASALGRLSGEEAMAAVVVALSDSSPNVRGSAVQALRELTRDIAPPAGATPALLAILDDESVYGRFAAATVLIRSGVPEGLNSWRARVGEGNGAQRAQAIREFVPDTPGAEAHDPRVIEVLLGMTGDPETEVRQAAISVLGRTGDGRAFEPVLKLLEDADPAVRRSAAVALGTLKDPRAVEPLIALLGRRGAPLNAPDERSVGARIEAASALEKITGQKFGADADAWQAWWNENKQAAPATAAGEER